MIVWPSESKLTPVAKGNLERFKATAAARALEDDTEQWRFMNWSWLAEPPIRFTLVNDQQHMVTFTLGTTGHYTMHEADVAPHVGKPLQPH